MARIGANLCSLYNEAEEQRRFLSVITDAEWGIKLGKLEVMKYLNQSGLFKCNALKNIKGTLRKHIGSQWGKIILISTVIWTK